MFMGKLGIGALVVIFAALAVAVFGIIRKTPVKVHIFQVLMVEVGTPAPQPAGRAKKELDKRESGDSSLGAPGKGPPSASRSELGARGAARAKAPSPGRKPPR